ncbi:MAG TPA: ribosome-associated translation inhibitor RaiA [Oscillatoriales cyanobacterium M59_W2019_021]|nr:MAG: ribosome-associated translation inhibitor RaiA [Cyanobacteria bacterium J055]HIK30611.1 ribosome-associated translation inhibitor RaiA [Oscillatoriales cyanobacterium M4454_W2019_049]HIK52121.1 ribosome-associated translation inhibitor RaiA [Oscillatoriales cyanobacterium M59_W2019_021]
MKLVIQGKNIEITDAIREYVTQKIDKAVNHFQNLTMEVDVNLSVERNPRITTSQSAEVTIYANGAVIRAQESSESMYASIDLVANKIARQLRKYKEKRNDKKTHAQVKTGTMVQQKPVGENLIGDRTPELPGEVVRTKYFAMPPMTPEEALENLKLVDHDFYMFLNSQTGEINVIYERNHGGYGIIQPRPGNGDRHKEQNGNGSVSPDRTHPQTVS